jgi:uncharacterized repeat protein (TIGR01451 family)
MHTRLTLEALEERTLLSNYIAFTPGELINEINMANASGTPSTIALQGNVSPNYIFSAQYPDNGGSALPTITGDITIVGNNNIIERASGSPAFRLFDVFFKGSLTLQNLTLEGGLAQGTGPAAEGGAIFSSGTLKLSGVAVQNNVAQGTSGMMAGGVGGSGAAAGGGGLYVAGGQVFLTNDNLSNNRAYGGIGGDGFNNTNKSGGNFISGPGGNGGNGGAAYGGGIYAPGGGSITLSGDIFSGNGAFGGSAGKGGEGEFGGNGGNGAAAYGGGLDVELPGETVTLNNDTFTSNVAIGGLGGVGGRGGYDGGGPAGIGGNGGASMGGGLHVVASNVTVSDSTLSGNEAVGGFGGNGGNGDAGSGSFGGAGGVGGNSEGAGMAVELADGTLTLTLSGDTLNGNLVFGGAGGIGGYGASAAQAGNGGGGSDGGDAGGGGLYVNGGSVTLTNDTLSGNAVNGGNGGLAGNGGEVHLSEFAGNYAEGSGGNGGTGGLGSGGGLFILGGSVSLGDDTISGNSVAGGFGGNGGAAGSGTTGFVIGVSFVPNSPSGNGGFGGNVAGGGVCLEANGTSLGLANTLIAENTLVAAQGGSGGPGSDPGASGVMGNAVGPDVSGSNISSDHDLIGDPSGSIGFSAANGDILDPAVVGLAPLADNGGPTETMALLPAHMVAGVAFAASAAIGTGDVKAPNLPATDQRGYSRIVNNTVDIGAYEFGATPPPQTPALAISGSGGSSTTPGGPITYTFTVTNTSSTAQSNVDVADQLPTNTTLVSWTAASGWSSSAPPAGSSSGTVSAAIASLPANSSATFTLVVQVAAGTPVRTVISNTASFGPFDETSNSGTNSVSSNTTVLYTPTLKVADGGTYNGNPFPATATAMDGTTTVAGTFSYAYYVGSGTGGMSLGSTPPTNAGTYTVVATFTSSNPDYSSGGTAQTTFMICRAPISYTIGNDTQAYGYPANLAADLPSSFSTGINGETLDISYSSSGDTSTAKPGTYDITGIVSNGTGLAANYCATLTDGTLTVLGPGVTVVGTQLWIVGGTTTNDSVKLTPVGSSTTGSTGVQVQTTLNGVSTSTPYSQSFSSVVIFLYGGNENVQLAPSLTLSAMVTAGNGNDHVQLGNGNNTVTLGTGNDRIQAGGGTNIISVGAAGSKGNDNIYLGNGNDNSVTLLGDGNDTVQIGNGNDESVSITGNGNDKVQIGDGNNDAVALLGNGNDNVQTGNGAGNTLKLRGTGIDNVDLGNGWSEV